jgi:hypothetical protein
MKRKLEFFPNAKSVKQLERMMDCPLCIAAGEKPHRIKKKDWEHYKKTLEKEEPK